ncbi:hypothetical protein Emag_003117 [Eimeria magna]
MAEFRRNNRRHPEAAAESEGLRGLTEAGRAGSAPDPSTSFLLKSEVRDPAIERPRSEASKASGAALADSELNLSSSLLGGEAATNQHPRKSASKLSHPLVSLLFLLLAAAAASSAFLLSERERIQASRSRLLSAVSEDTVKSPPPVKVPLHRFEAPLPSEETTRKAEQPTPDRAVEEHPKGHVAAPVAAVSGAEEETPDRAVEEDPKGHEAAPVAAVSGVEEEEQLKSDQAGAAASEEDEDDDQKILKAFIADPLTAEGQRDVVEAFKLMFGEGKPKAAAAHFWGSSATGFVQFAYFKNHYQADLEGGEEKDEETRERTRRWTLYKMQMAILASMEVESLEGLDMLSRSPDGEQAAQEMKAKLQEIYQMKGDLASSWTKVATAGGLHPESSREETVMSMLKAQKAHSEIVLERLDGPGKTPISRGNPGGKFRKLCQKLSSSCSSTMSNSSGSKRRSSSENSEKFEGLRARGLDHDEQPNAQFEDSASGRSQNEPFEELDVNRLDPQLDLRSSSFNEEIKRSGQPRGAAFQLRYAVGGLLFLLLAVAVASSGILLVRRRRGEAPLLSPEASVPPSEALKALGVGRPAPDKGDKKKLDEVSASSLTEPEGDIVREFERTFITETPGEVIPNFLKGVEKHLEQFRHFVRHHKADLEGGEEKNEGARQRRKRWTLFKMQTATVTKKEIDLFRQATSLALQDDDAKALNQAEAELEKLYKLRNKMAGMWMKLATEGGLHPDPAKDEVVLNLLKTQELHYWKSVKQPSRGELPAPKADNYKIDCWAAFREVFLELPEEDQWLMHTVP